MRNIANVVHDLRPIIKYLKEKLAATKEVNDPKEFLALLSKLNHDAVMLDLYLDALEKDAKAHGITKIQIA